jgi:hypothetical protein
MAGALRDANLRGEKFPDFISSTRKPGNGAADTLGMTPLLFRLAFRFDDRLLAELAWLLELGDLRAMASA